MTPINRIYRHKIVSYFTLDQIEQMIEADELDNCGDYGLKNDWDVRLIFSVN
ncbi:MAG TPA: hypothetical protein VEC16_00400 [Alphaproteobacteria bacterium]|nr:hypothetical protein [Alphaproteobacteria bacterium]